MDIWVIDYALHVKSMEEAEYSPDEVAGFCDMVNACLATRGFAKRDSLGLHASAQADAVSAAYLACVDLSAIEGSDQFISKLILFRVKDLNDLLPVVFASKVSSDNEGIRGQLDSEHSDNAKSPGSSEGITIASTVAAVVQDLFLDGPGQYDRKPQVAPKRVSPVAKAS